MTNDETNTPTIVENQRQILTGLANVYGRQDRIELLLGKVLRRLDSNEEVRNKALDARFRPIGEVYQRNA